MPSWTSITRATAALLPLFRHSSSASRSASRSMRSASFHSRFCRSRGRVRLQAESSKAWRAAFTARSTSAGVAAGTWQSSSPVAGLRRSISAPSLEDVHSAPISIFGARCRKARDSGLMGSEASISNASC
ncbi:hypothetical protein D9M68_282800 [compost metagenome]